MIPVVFQQYGLSLGEVKPAAFLCEGLRAIQLLWVTKLRRLDKLERRRFGCNALSAVGGVGHQLLTGMVMCSSTTSFEITSVFSCWSMGERDLVMPRYFRGHKLESYEIEGLQCVGERWRIRIPSPGGARKFKIKRRDTRLAPTRISARLALHGWATAVRVVDASGIWVLSPGEWLATILGTHPVSTICCRFS
ncbi:hypothetical protein F511_32783 [Dorcoceras hygrometricum]|uniref:Uncharacterized protein n=1 Tax=Dorcoceras hygrometricum TaxID=472368 RepID=A0A2Z7BY78_9LAMI|nr:hypothetical protein F511_32783 [Dorcoceras hygrometricum]